MPKNHQAVQACHASIATGKQFVKCDEPPNLVLCTIESASKLQSCSERLKEAGIKHSVFYEDDMGGRATALATEPITQKDRKHFRLYPLLS